MSQFNLPEPTADPLLQLIGRYQADTRENKIDLGVGVYRDHLGNTPVMAAVKEAESRLHREQHSKSYLGLTGDIEFVDALGELLFTDCDVHIGGAQTPGGSGALRLAAEAYMTAHPDGVLLIGLPTWPNHIPLTESVGVKNKSYRYFDPTAQQIDFDAMMTAITSARAGDAIILHGCCHNPTGADLSTDQWQQLAEHIAENQIIPIVDLAYHGLGDGLEADLAATRIIARKCAQAIVATSCSKNFGLYRDRTGAVFMTTHDSDTACRAQAFFGQIARKIYSMPPDHGAAVVKIILTDPDLKKQWAHELQSMVERIHALRQAMSEADARLAFVANQKGMFSLLPSNPDQVNSLIDDHGVYLAPDGRINVAGCQHEQISRFVEALDSVGFNGVHA